MIRVVQVHQFRGVSPRFEADKKIENFTIHAKCAEGYKGRWATFSVFVAVRVETQRSRREWTMTSREHFFLDLHFIMKLHIIITFTSLLLVDMRFLMILPSGKTYKKL